MVASSLPVFWTDPALRALDRICYYLEERASRETALRVRRRIIAETQGLGRMPRKFPADPHYETDPRDMRFRVVFKSYRISYEVSEYRVLVFALAHTSQDSYLNPPP